MDTQLREAFFPDLDRTFESLDFDKVDSWDLLIKVAAGGKMSLRGSMYENQPRYDQQTMRYVFIVKARALVTALMFTVISKQANVTFMHQLPLTRVLHP